MKCCEILGNLADYNIDGRQIVYVDFEWYELNKKIQIKCGENNREIGICLDENVLIYGLMADDILFETEHEIYAVRIIPCEVVKVSVGSLREAIKVCYEIGNRHAPLFYGENENILLTPYNEPMYEMLKKLHADCEKTMGVLATDKKISSGAGHHHHSHEE